MKKTELNKAVTNYKSEMEYVITTIINSISAPGQRKKILSDEKVQDILNHYDIVIEE